MTRRALLISLLIALLIALLMAGAAAVVASDERGGCAAISARIVRGNAELFGRMKS